MATDDNFLTVTQPKKLPRFSLPEIFVTRVSTPINNFVNLWSNGNNHPTNFEKKKGRKFTLHNRDSFTKAWIDIHHLDNAGKMADPQNAEESFSSPIENIPEHKISRITVNDENVDKASEKAVINFFLGDTVSRQVSMTSTSSESDGIKHERWIDNQEALTAVNKALTVFYALMLTIFAFVLELSHAFQHQRIVRAKDFVFGIYMYGLAIVYLFYCYIVLLLNPRWHIVLERLASWVKFQKYNTESSVNLDGVSSVAVVTIHRKASHDAPSAGSMFLRLGCVVFGIIGTVYYAFSVFLCIINPKCEKQVLTIDVFAIMFIFTQMHFLFCNWKMTVMRHHTIARFGTMHLLAVNVWMWIQYILKEETELQKEITEIFKSGGEHRNNESPPIVRHNDEDERVTAKNVCIAAECFLGSITNIMYTSIVEYSLIGAAVMFIVWKNIDHMRPTSHYVKRKHQIRIDCSKTTSGLFFGLVFIAATFTSMAAFYGYSAMGENYKAAFVFSCTDIFQYIIASLACLYTLWTMRLLKYQRSTEHKAGNPSAELLDIILLCLGMTGEMIYSIAGIVGLTGDNIQNASNLTLVLTTCHIFRLMQVGLQCCLIYITSHLRIHNSNTAVHEKQPGKQFITFLLIANISMFFMNLFETEKAGVSDAVVNFYGKDTWVLFVRGFSPLTIFFRFHSSVCFAEIWKNVYAHKQ